MPERPLHGCGIAITRPIEQAEKLAAFISAQGGTPILFPLLDIVPLENDENFEQKLSALTRCNWAIFISSNAVQNAMPRLLAKWGCIPQNLKFAAIGPATAAELTKFGVKQVLIPQDRFDSESLLTMPEMQSMQQQNVMIFRGVGGRELLGVTLAARGATVDYAECYQRVNPQKDDKLLAGLWKHHQLQAIVVTSSEAMRFLLELVKNPQENPEAGTWLQNITVCVNHARIAELALNAGLTACVAEASGDEAMLQCLIKALNVKKS